MIILIILLLLKMMLTPFRNKIILDKNNHNKKLMNKFKKNKNKNDAKIKFLEKIDENSIYDYFQENNYKNLNGFNQYKAYDINRFFANIYIKIIDFFKVHLSHYKT